MPCQSPACTTQWTSALTCRHTTSLDKVRAEGRAAAEAARGEVVEPLKEEVERMRQQLEEAQSVYEVLLCLNI